MGVRQGPDIGTVLNELLEDVLDNPSHNESDFLKMRAEELLKMRNQNES